jgi:hypothetical protein
MKIIGGVAAAWIVAVGLADAQVQTRVDLRCLTARDCLDKPMSPSEPHGAICATCHDMMAQRSFREARATCTGAGCHTSPETLTPFHRGLTSGVLSNCVGCHDPHDVVVPGGGDNCKACHTPGVRMARPRSFEPRALPGRPSGMDLTFRHTQHQRVECAACHVSDRAHGRTTITGLRDCRSCHHTQPQSANCATCHKPSEVRNIVAWVPRTLNIQIGTIDRPTRRLPLDHEAHASLQCTACHTSGLALSAAQTNCSSCHAAHHHPEASCRDCHDQPAAIAHTREAHLSCAGSGCHTAVPATLREVPRTRAFCITCHQDRVDHKAPKNCAECHILPRPRLGR